jgi:uncharacterized protein (TIGR03437 family)
LEYDFVVAPGADPSRIAWRIDGARASVDAEGNLALSAPNGPASFKKPVLYQMDGDKRVSVDGSFAVAGKEVRFRLGSYDHSRTLIIDPVLSYASYLEGISATHTDHIGAATGPGYSQTGTSQGLAVDSAGSAYVTGYTYSIDFPTKNPLPGESAPPAKQYGGSNVPAGQWSTAFVTKFSPDGSSLVYSTYLGGNGSDNAYAIAVDSNFNAYVTGQTTSAGFPITTGAYQTVCAPIANNTGEPSAASNCNPQDYSAFVTKLNSTGTGLVYSTFLGGYGNWSYGTAIAVDAAGRAYVAGNEDVVCSAAVYSFRSCFPTTSGAVIAGTSPGGGSPQYAFLAAFDPTGAQLLYSTLFGDLNFVGGADTYATGVTVDQNGYFYLVGNTRAGKLPTTAGVVQPNAVPLDSNGLSLQTWRGFIARFNPVTSTGGASLAWSTYLGGKTGNTGDYMSGIAVDSASYVYVVGYTNSTDFPVTAGTFGTVCAPGGGTCAAAHVTKLKPDASAIVWSTYVGGSKHDGSDTLFFTGPIQLDGKGNIYIMGQSGGTGFPLVNPVEPTGNGGAQEVIVAELDPTGSNLLFSTRIGSGALHTSGPAGLAVDPVGNIYLAGNIIGTGLITTPGAFQTTSSDSAGCCYHGFVAKITTTPQISLAGIGNAANYVAGKVSPGEIIVVYGQNFGPAALAQIQYVNGVATTTLGNTSVYFDNVAAPMIYAVAGSPGVLSCVVPYAVKTSTQVQVAYNGVKGNALTVPVVDSVPGIFSLSQTGTGPGAILNWPDYSINGTSNRVAAGGYIMAYATGEGKTDIASDGQHVPLLGPYPEPLLSPWTATVGGKPATVTYSGSAPDNIAGVFQVNLQIPTDLTTGVYDLVIKTGNFSSTAGLTVAVK